MEMAARRTFGNSGKDHHDEMAEILRFYVIVKPVGLRKVQKRGESGR